MPSLSVNGKQISYLIEGEGFPLILVPDAEGTIRDWAPALPLLGELCRVIAYEYTQRLPAANVPSLSDGLVDDLVILLNALAIERAYVAGYASGGDVALRLAFQEPNRLEGLLLISPGDEASQRSSLASLSVPLLIVVGEEASEHLEGASRLAAQLPHCSSTILQGARVALHREQPLPLGHAMLAFLIQCERQRTLVRGASFLL
jgi:pimeloyl-ACP methyl ester carboxylesterase